MQVCFFDTHGFEKPGFESLQKEFGQELRFFEPRLTLDTAELARGSQAVCAFVNDHLDEATLAKLQGVGVKLVALRCAGFNHVDLAAAKKLGITVVRVPEYSPHAVAEHAACLMLALNRKIHRAYARVREHNFSLDGLVGFDLFGKTVGVVGTGKIGCAFARIMLGFGSKVIAHDMKPDAGLEALDVSYGTLDSLIEKSDVLSLHVPLSSATRHLLDARAFSRMKSGVMLINTGRGGLIDTPALIDALKSGKVGSAGLDVYEEEESLFFRDLSDFVLTDDVMARLLTFPNVLVTSHQAFLTREALEAIARTTLGNIRDFESGLALPNQVMG